jgi:hypothetical protein
MPDSAPPVLSSSRPRRRARAPFSGSTAEFAETAANPLCDGLPFRPTFPTNRTEPAMGKEQRASKNEKKPKKDAAPPKAAGTDRPTPPVTAVLPKGKLAKKPL